ncbi:hypothetical protein CBL_12916 [Carabus blaptoides fortunei]
MATVKGKYINQPTLLHRAEASVTVGSDEGAEPLKGYRKLVYLNTVYAKNSPEQTITRKSLQLGVSRGINTALFRRVANPVLIPLLIYSFKRAESGKKWMERFLWEHDSIEAILNELQHVEAWHEGAQVSEEAF